MSVQQRPNAMAAAARALNQPPEAIPASSEESDIRPAVPGHVIRKLLAFAAALIILPILTYFATVNTLFAGNATKAASFGALVAQAVLFTYVAIVIRDDMSEQDEGKKKKEENKDGEGEGKKDQ